MSEGEQHIQSLFVQYLVAHMQCSGCGRHYEPDDVHVHNHRGYVWLASLTCRHCGLRALVMAAIRDQDVEQMPAVEFDAQEWEAFQEMGLISSDEILDLHCFLTDYHGDAVHLFQKPQQ